MTQDELLDALEDQREQLLDAIDDLSDEELLEPGVVGNWSMRDIIYHLCMWEAELVKLLWQASQGEKPTTRHFEPASVEEINAIWQQQAQERDLDHLLDDFAAVRKQTSRRVSAASDSFGHESEHMLQIHAWRAARNK
jgi:hypothetical protein